MVAVRNLEFYRRLDRVYPFLMNHQTSPIEWSTLPSNANGPFIHPIPSNGAFLPRGLYRSWQRPHLTITLLSTNTSIAANSAVV